MKLPYRLEATPSRVDFYTQDRLPLEPTGLMQAGRAQLRSAVQQLQPKPGYRLEACLTSPCPSGGFDVENILFYNVGNAHFRKCTQEGLYFKMRHGGLLDAKGFFYHHRYEMVVAEPTEVEPQVVFHLDFLNPQAKPHSIWWQARHGMRRDLPEKIGKFRLSVLLHTPQTKHGLTDIVKPLLDGIIASFHYQPRGMDPLAESRLAEKIGVSTEEVGQALSDAAGTPLGARKILSAYRESVKWNAADDLCMECAICWQPSPDGRIRVAATVSAAD